MAANACAPVPELAPPAGGAPRLFAAYAARYFPHAGTGGGNEVPPSAVAARRELFDGEEDEEEGGDVLGHSKK